MNVARILIQGGNNVSSLGESVPWVEISDGLRTSTSSFSPMITCSADSETANCLLLGREELGRAHTSVFGIPWAVGQSVNATNSFPSDYHFSKSYSERSTAILGSFCVVRPSSNQLYNPVACSPGLGLAHMR